MIQKEIDELSTAAMLTRSNRRAFAIGCLIPFSIWHVTSASNKVY